MGSAHRPTYPDAAGLGDRLSHFFNRLSAAPMPDHMIQLIEDLERAHAVETADIVRQDRDGLE